MKLTRFCLPACLWAAISPGYAQKLPNLQASNYRAPDSIRTDGRLTEINNQLKAYNQATDVYYTLANNGKYLYLAVRAHNELTIRKLIGGGIRLDLKAAGAAPNTHLISITGLMAGTSKMDLGLLYNDKDSLSKDSSRRNMQTDSLVHLLNQSLYAGMKEIKVKGVEGLTDSLVSVYNDEDIRAMASFDSNLDLNYELTIPLDILKAGNGQAFNYTVTLEGLSSSSNTHYITDPVYGGVASLTAIPRSLSAGIPNGSADWQTLNNPTTFKGTYLIAK